MLNRFLSPRLERLSAEGDLTSISAGEAVFLPPIVLIDRDLCVYERFASPATGRAARAAARLYGRTAAPFDRAGFIMTPCPGGYGLWWWDADQIDGLLAARSSRGLPAAVPETLAQPPGRDWRQVRLAKGYEAQRWAEGRLVASAWRPSAFDDASWVNFTRTAVEPGEDAPLSPPSPQSLPAVASLTLLSLGARRGGIESYRQVAVVFAVTLALGLSSFFAGQAWRLSEMTDRTEAEAATLISQQSQGEVQRLRANLARVDGFTRLLDRPDPSASLAVAIGVLQLYGVPPTSFRSDAQGVRLELPYAALEIAPEIAGQLASTGGFTNVNVTTGSGRSSVIFEMGHPVLDGELSLPAGQQGSFFDDPADGQPAQPGRLQAPDQPASSPDGQSVRERFEARRAARGNAGSLSTPG